MSLAKSNSVSLSVDGRIAHVVLSRPDKRNAFDASMIEELREVFLRLRDETAVWAVLVRGDGASFCAGADLEYMQSMASFSLSENHADAKRLDDMFWAARNCLIPIVGKIHGHAMGGGLGLAAICDIAAAVEGTQFAFSEVRLGLAPAVIAPYVLEKMHPATARRYMLSGETFSTTEANESGLAQFVGTESEVDSFIAKTLERLTGNGREAMRESKRLLRNLNEISAWPGRRHLTTKVIAERRASAEGQEGLRAFLEKRSPGWRPS